MSFFKSSSLMMIFLLGALFSSSNAFAQTPCTGNNTDTADGTPFVNGFDYEFITNAAGDVTINVELLDTQSGLVAFTQTYNPNFAELQMASTGGQSFTITYLAADVTDPFNVAIKFAFAGGLSTSPILTFDVAACEDMNTNVVCTGTVTETADGTPFVDGFTYEFITNPDGDVMINVELLDPQVGLVAFAQTYNPNFAEMQMTNTGGQTFTITYLAANAPDPFNVAIKFAFAGGLSTSTIQTFSPGGPCPGVVLTAPVTNPDEPTCDAADVVSIYGDFYPTNIATNYDPNWGQSGHMLVDPAYDPGTGNPILAYPNFNYQGTELTTTDLSAMDYLHFDVWTAADAAATTLQVSPINMGTGPAEILVDVPFVSGEWTKIVLEKADFGGMTWDAVFQMKFAANGPGSANPVDIYLDNVYFSSCSGEPLTAPVTNAPEPTCDPADVVSIYGDFYPTNIATNYDPNWGQSGHMLVDPAYDPGTGDVILAYPNFNYQGTELVTTDLSAMTHLYIDVWTAADAAATTLQVSPINMGTGPAEILVDVPFVSGEWTTVVLEKADFGGMTWDAVFQMKFAANGPGSANPVDIYLDNIYFSTCEVMAATAPTTNAPEPTCDPANVVSVYGDFYQGSIATNYDPNWGQSGHMLVDPATYQQWASLTLIYGLQQILQ